MLSTILFAAWCFTGMVCIGLARVKTPPDTALGKEHPDMAWAAWTLMLLAWPLTVWHRHKFARHGDPRDENNPSWLAEDRSSLGDR